MNKKLFLITVTLVVLFFLLAIVYLIKSDFWNERKVVIENPLGNGGKKIIVNPPLEEDKLDNIELNKNIESLTLEKIFDDNVSIYDEVSKEDTISLVATGDYGVGREVNYRTTQYNNFNWAVEEFAPLIKSADISLINLEGPIVYDCPIMHSGFTFCGDDKHVEGLNFAGIDIVNVANNHAGNYGIEGVGETTEILSKNNILISGLHENSITYKDVKGIKFAFLGYNDVGVQAGIATADVERIKKEVAEAKSNSDVVVVSFHWGVEYTTNITERQKELSHIAVDNGAELIIGNHGHWIQPLEIYKDKLITYAHGNFIFDQMWSEETREGVVGEYVFYKNHLADVKFHPVYIVDYGRATIPDLERKTKILERLKSISFAFAESRISN